MTENKTKRVGILRGGVGENYEESLIRGGDIIMYLHEHLNDKFKPYDILIDKENVWHLNGLPISPSELAQRVDIVWNLAGGEVTQILNILGIPNISVDLFASSLENSRELLAEHVKSVGVKMPRRVVLPVYQRDIDGDSGEYINTKAKEIFEKFPPPWIVRSYNEDKTMGIHVAKDFVQLVEAIKDGVSHGDSISIEEFVEGAAGSVHSIMGFRSYLPMHDSEVYVIPPENLSKEEKSKLMDLVKELHKHINADFYLKSDFVIHPKRGAYLTGINLFPDLRPGSHLDESAKSIGARMRDIVEHIFGKVLK